MLRDLPRLLLDDLIALLLPALCPRCRRPVAEPALCPPCRRVFSHATDAWDAERAPTRAGVARLCAAALFDGELVDWIHRFKYPRAGWRGLDPAPAALLAGLLREAAAQLGERVDAVVPVPLHPRRVRERGFDPVYELARVAARALGAPLAANALCRTRATASQTGLDRAARRRNVAGAFAARADAVPEGAALVLVDDVVTTGATLREAAAVLRAAGASRVLGLCVARTPLGG